MANHIIAHEGICDAYGHISVRNPENKDHYFISRAIAPETATLDDILEMDMDGKIVVGKPGFRPFSECVIHTGIYKARPDVNCVCHTHPLDVMPFCCSDVPLRNLTHLGVVFYEGIPLFKELPPECGLLINTKELGDQIAATLENKRGLLIRNHGIVVACESIPRTVYSAITMRDMALVLQKTLSMGVEPMYVEREEAEYGTRIEFCGQGLNRSWDYWCKRARQAYPELNGVY